MALVRRDFFRDALTVYEIMGQVSGFDTADVAYWSKLHTSGDAPPDRGPGPGPSTGDSTDDPRTGKRRRRRRGGRRRRRTALSEAESGEREPAWAG